MRRPIALLVPLALVVSLLAAAPAVAADPEPAGPTVFVGEVTRAQLGQLGELGVDRRELALRPAGQGGGQVAIEAVLTPLEAAKLQSAGIALTEKSVAGRPASEQLRRQAATAASVFRPYSGPGGIREELEGLARQYPRLTKLVRIGRSVQGQPILALKVTRDARKVPDGQRPAVLYSSTQHAREWITPEMNRRLLRHVLEHSDSDLTLRRTLRSTELWFVPVANPDGYDYTFTPGNRLWRKNLRDNDGNGVITAVDGVDPNRNFSYRWGYDDEGSSPSWASATYRGPRPGSEPETRALDGLMRRIGFAFQLNYHSAAELLLYGTGWQVATPTPDDLIFEALLGDDANPAVPGYDPDIAAELYTTNGETTEHAQSRYGTLAVTPEMATCQTASAVDPDDAFNPDDCVSIFNFPDSEPLVQAEFEKNLALALAVARSAKDPSRPVSVVGRSTPDFQLDPFAVSYGNPQTVGVTARREFANLRLRYSVNGGRTVTARVQRWRGGERYGDEGNTYYAEFRGVVRGTRPGDRVRVWFTGIERGEGRRTSRSFTYRVAEDTRNSVLVVADEDYRGVNPTYPASVTAPKYARTYVTALRRAGLRASVWDVTARGVPHHLGVLSHFRSVVWYLGDNRLTQDPEDEVTDVGGQEVRDAAVAERAQDLTVSVRDYLNERGTLVHTGETAGYFGELAGLLGGIYYGLDGDPGADCVVTQGLDDCLILSDDFRQYYLGAWERRPTAGPSGVVGRGVLAGRSATFGGPAVQANPLNEAGEFVVTSDVLPVNRFPQFASQAAASYQRPPGAPFNPVEGRWYAAAAHVDNSYARLTRTVDLRGVTAAQAPQLQAKLSYDLEEGYDHVLVEAHPVGSDAWTTLPEVGGLSSATLPAECTAGFLLELHPFLTRYLTGGETACRPTGTTGAWNSMTGNSGGWQQTGFDLSAYAGQQVEVSISYVTDPSTGGLGVFVDDTRLRVGGAGQGAEGFETGLGPWSVTGPPASSPPGGTSFRRSEGLLAAAVATDRTLLLGFGVEQVASAANRTRVLGQAVRTVQGRPRS